MNKTFTSMDNFVGYDDFHKIPCPVCGKMFKPAPEHIYHIRKNKRDLCCSWTCQRNWEKNKTTAPVKKKNKYGRPIKIAETGETFRNIRECAERLGVHYATAYKAVVNGWLCNGYHLVQVEEVTK